MLDKMVHIKIGEKEYPITFTLNVMESIQEKYGTIDKWQSNLIERDETPIKDVVWIFQELLNEAIDIENDDREVKLPKLEHKQVARIITSLGVVKAVRLIFETVSNAMPKEEENPNGIANPTQN
jgi:hypothetical protein